jgi:hypothetical protein
MRSQESIEKRRALSRNYWKKNHAWLIEQKSKPCSDCGGYFPYFVMQFDHRPGEIKLFGLAQRATRSRALLEAEIAKCDLVCANCHAVRGYIRRFGMQT